MSIFLRWVCLVCVAIIFFPALHAAEVGKIYVAPLKTDVSEAQFFFLRRALKDAERANASAFIIDMNTNGGEVGAALDAMDALLQTKVPTFTYINPRALSAGAYISVATQQIYMSPTAVIGAAAPVTSTGENLPETMNDKSISVLSATIRAAAQKNGHNAEVADAFVDKKKEVKIGEVLISAKDSLLSLSAEEAARKIDGKPVLAAGIAPTLEAMIEMAGLHGEVIQVEPSGVEKLAVWITMLAPIFLVGGILGAYIEFKMPGFGLPGILSIICFGISFFGHYVAGLAGFEVVLVFALGVLLVVLEMFVLPGTFFLGITGAFLMLGSLIYSMVDRWPSQPVWPSSEQLLQPMITLSQAGLLAAVAIAILAKVLPHTPLYQKIVLQSSVPTGHVDELTDTGVPIAVGMTGTAQTVLRPSGKATFDGRPFHVVSNGPFIEPETSVRVIDVRGARIVVEPV
ncbi:MAG: NfeD family protein [Chthoniobacteraceae bacterium]